MPPNLLLRRCIACKRRYASLSGETSYCPTCRPSSLITPSPRDEELLSSLVPKNTLISPPGNVNADIDISIHKQEGKQVETTLEATTVIDLCSVDLVDSIDLTTSAERTTEHNIAKDNTTSLKYKLNDMKDDADMDINIHKQEAKQVQTTLETVTVIDLCSEVDIVDIDLTTSADTDTEHNAAEDNHTSFINNDNDKKDAANFCASMLDSSCYKCVVCGTSLQHIATLQGRVFHLKQCSRKYGMQARDFKKDDEDEEMHYLVSPKKTITVIQKQPTIDNFFKSQVPVVAVPRSLNCVLVDNAKRLAKFNEITRKNEKPSSKKRPAAAAWKGASKKNNNNYCPIYKRITGTDLICDGFYYANSTLSTKYFLSHFHYDHYGGLTKSWNCGTIYCSVATANLVHQQLGVDRKFLHPLELQTPIVIESRGKAVTVTLLDANHCPGAVMFLFQIGSSKTNILHVGDFRWNRETMLQKSSPLLPFFHLKDVRLDELFLDTTYCDEKYTNIPSQREAIDAAMKAIEKELADCAKRRLKPLLLFGSYTIGKERIYLEVCARLKVKAMVDKKRYKTLEALNLPPEQMRLLTTTKSETFVRIVPLGHINFKSMPSYASSADNALSKPYDCIIGFRPTGWTFSEKSSKDLVTKRTSGNLTIYGVPYSEHSNFTELVDSLHCLKPKKIIPTVSTSKSDEQVAVLLQSLQKMQINQRCG